MNSYESTNLITANTYWELPCILHSLHKEITWWWRISHNTPLMLTPSAGAQRSRASCQGCTAGKGRTEREYGHSAAHVYREAVWKWSFLWCFYASLKTSNIFFFWEGVKAIRTVKTHFALNSWTFILLAYCKAMQGYILSFLKCPEIWTWHSTVTQEIFILARW